MILREALAAIPRRIRRPLVFTLIAVVTTFYIAVAALMPHLAKHFPSPPPFRPLSVGYALLMLMGTTHVFALTAFPWQWTGDDRPMAPPLRGALQAFAFCVTVSSLSTLIHLEQIRATYARVPDTVPRAFLYAMGAMGLLVGAGFNALIGFAMAYWETKKAEKELAQHQVEEARWTLLKAQMSPHVLLNSLNGLAELVRDDPAAAVKGMRDLAEIYHQLLTLGNAPKAPLSQERVLLERYLAVEQLRLGEQLKVDWAWDSILDSVVVMPLLLQPLVENAIKHGIAADPNGGVLRIEAHRSDDWLHLAVANTGHAARPTTKPGGGLGLRNLKSRLELAYGGKATFQLVKEQDWIRAELKLPLETP